MPEPNAHPASAQFIHGKISLYILYNCFFSQAFLARCQGGKRLEVGGCQRGCWGDSSSVRSVAAKVWLAARLRRADHRETEAVWMAGCRRAGACRALDLAKSRMKVAASWLHRPPTWMASTTSLQRRVARSSGCVRSLLRRAACRAAPPLPCVFEH